MRQIINITMYIKYNIWHGRRISWAMNRLFWKSYFSSKTAEIANKIKTTPPTKVTVLTEIIVAMKRPPITARPVHKACPKQAPNVTPTTFSREASTTVAIWDRSPHSAKKVIVNVSMNTRLTNCISFRLMRVVKATLLTVRITPVSGSSVEPATN